MTRVIHTGDTHIGYQQYHSPVRRRDFLAAFESVIDDAVDDDVDAVVHAGDLFHDRRPDLPDLLGTISALRRLDDADIPFLAVVGNHESTRGGQWLDLFERLGLATRLGEEPVVVGDTAFYGLDHVPASRRDELEYAYEPHDVDYAALVAHGLFEPFAHADWDTETVLTESTVAFDALLLGDNHKPDRATVAGTWVTYPGSTERASASEREGRGYNLVTFGGDGSGDGDAVDIRRRALETREFVFITVELHDGEGESRAREAVRAHDLTDAVALVEIVGEGDPVTPAAIEEVAESEGALIARVTDRREIDTEAEFDVSFADPEAAVRERVESMGLSEAARGIDETVRSEGVVDTNVRETVKDQISELIDDPGAFTPATGEDATSGGDGQEEPSGEERTEATERDGADGDESGGSSDEDERDDGAEGNDGDDGDHGTESIPSEQQVSMEDYL
ncbi:DNA double-strand break repair protein Mre11 [Halorubrum vacuolatum]|uniref:DNA double-strand break repair protein Mre11 n=1 Tax=Halorubrum vacuolatum TaxID=63740 RepID=A0A238X4F4_HALVU|nr:DNA double-strand break repair protein Mre11 [Halorubrum vacuolatum]SNR53590.1 DNA repair exonuclease SbcCD nuclease subunit [Halorubrum vacuolatum]